jgi:peptidoglycan/LPS O-acetylase OafA/YrhL
LTSLNYRRDIDGLRAVAVLLVLVFHFELLPIGEAGFIGVDVFFVISGFLITSIVWRQLESKTFSFSDFYAARVRRLAPALVVTLTGVFAYGVWRLTPTELSELSRQIAAAQFYFSNIFYWQNVHYFGLQSESVALLHTWSLAVEEQFYLVYPAALVLLHRWSRKWFWHIIALMGVLSFGLNLAFVGAKPMATFYLLPSRAWELILGAMLAAPALRMPSSRTFNEGLGVTGALLILAAVLFYREGMGLPGWFATLPALGGVCLILAGADVRTSTSRLLSTGPMVFVGKVSYVAYLVHWPLHVFAQRQWGESYGLSLRWLMFLLSIGLAWAIWRWIEAPVRERRFFQGNRSVAWGYAGVLIATAGATLAVVRSEGWPQRLPLEARRLAAYASDKSPPLRECEYSGNSEWAPESTCRIGASGVAPRWLVFGDSHAWAGHSGFDLWLQARGESAWFAYRNSCPPLRGLHLAGDVKSECHRFNEGVYSWLTRNPQIYRVFMVSTWFQAPEGRLSESTTQHLDPNRSLLAFNGRFGASLQELRKAGKTIYIWGPVPGARRHLPQTLSISVWQGTSVDLEVPRDEHYRQFDFFYSALELNRESIDVPVIPAADLCESGRCRVIDGDRLLYQDNSHVTASTADVWAGIIHRAETKAALNK